MRFLVICSTLDMSEPFGATPFVWQFLKGLHDAGSELTVVPYYGPAVTTPWWHSEPNPIERSAKAFRFYMKAASRTGSGKAGGSWVRDSLAPRLGSRWVLFSWERLLRHLERQPGFDACLAIGVPLNQAEPLLLSIRTRLEIPVISYDLDAPTSLPRYGGFSFSPYLHAHPEKMDAVVIPSEGSVADLEAMGARVHVLHFGVDPELYTPLATAKDIDVFFFGLGTGGREHYLQMFMAEPARQRRGRFLISGGGPNAAVPGVEIIPGIRFHEMRAYICRSKINLNIPRSLQAEVYGTSTSRPFELAALGACILSRPYAGLELWYQPGKELLVVNTPEEVMEAYDWLLGDEAARTRLGESARQRTLKDHTMKSRAAVMVGIAQKAIDRFQPA